MKYSAFAYLSIGLLASVPLSAKSTEFTVTGKFASIEYSEFDGNDDDFLRDTFVAQVPMGSPYVFTFSYDPSAHSTVPHLPQAGYFPAVPVGGLFRLGGAEAQLSTMSVTVGLVMNPTDAVFSMFANADYPTPRLGDFRMIDFGLTLIDHDGVAVLGPDLPRNLDLSLFEYRDVRVRYARFGLGGELGVHFTIDSFTSNSTVPEPASWAMMIFGFGLCGSQLRRRQAASPARV